MSVQNLIYNKVSTLNMNHNSLCGTAGTIANRHVKEMQQWGMLTWNKKGLKSSEAGWLG